MPTAKKGVTNTMVQNNSLIFVSPIIYLILMLTMYYNNNPTNI